MVVFYHSSAGYYRILSTDVPAFGQILLRQTIHLRTVIVTADIDEGLVPRAAKRPLARSPRDRDT